MGQIIGAPRKKMNILGLLKRSSLHTFRNDFISKKGHPPSSSLFEPSGLEELAL